MAASYLSSEPVSVENKTDTSWPPSEGDVGRWRREPQSRVTYPLYDEGKPITRTLIRDFLTPTLEYMKKTRHNFLFEGIETVKSDYWLPGSGKRLEDKEFKLIIEGDDPKEETTYGVTQRSLGYLAYRPEWFLITRVFNQMIKDAGYARKVAVRFIAANYWKMNIAEPPMVFQKPEKIPPTVDLVFFYVDIRAFQRSLDEHVDLSKEESSTDHSVVFIARRDPDPKYFGNWDIQIADSSAFNDVRGMEKYFATFFFGDLSKEVAERYKSVPRKAIIRDPDDKRKNEDFLKDLIKKYRKRSKRKPDPKSSGFMALFDLHLQILDCLDYDTLIYTPIPSINYQGRTPCCSILAAFYIWFCVVLWYPPEYDSRREPPTASDISRYFNWRTRLYNTGFLHTFPFRWFLAIMINTYLTYEMCIETSNNTWLKIMLKEAANEKLSPEGVIEKLKSDPRIHKQLSNNGATLDFTLRELYTRIYDNNELQKGLIKMKPGLTAFMHPPVNRDSPVDEDVYYSQPLPEPWGDPFEHDTKKSSPTWYDLHLENDDVDDDDDFEESPPDKKRKLSDDSKVPSPGTKDRPIALVSDDDDEDFEDPKQKPKPAPSPPPYWYDGPVPPPPPPPPGGEQGTTDPDDMPDLLSDDDFWDPPTKEEEWRIFRDSYLGSGFEERKGIFESVVFGDKRLNAFLKRFLADTVTRKKKTR